MKWLITILAVVICTTIACEKSSSDTMVAGARGEVKGNLVGTWELIQYYEQDGAGNGGWKTPTFTETISFGSDGSFSSTPTFPMYSAGYTRYETKDMGWVTLFRSESQTGDRFQYVLESPTQLLFYPTCREQCMRRYQLK